jgi:hypothetical protein
VVYSQKAPVLAQRQRWIAAVEAAVTCPELAIALRHFDAAVLWDSVRRPAEDGKWASAQVLSRRPGLVPASWQYLVAGGPTDLPEVSHNLLGCHYVLSYEYTRTRVERQRHEVSQSQH